MALKQSTSVNDLGGYVTVTSTEDVTANSLTATNGFGCNGKTAQTEYTVNADSIDLATVIALCNQLRAALIANGICV